MQRGAKIAVATTMLVAGVAVAIVFRKPPPGPRIEAVEDAPLPRAEAPRPTAPLVVQQPAPAAIQPPLVVAPVFPKVTLEWPGELGPEATLGIPCELPPGEVTSHKVRDGDTLSGLARKYLGSPDRYKELLEANRDTISSPQRLRVGVVLRIPRGGATPLPPSGAAPMVPIDKGDWRKATPGPRGL